MASPEPITTHISADVQKLYEDTFLAGQTQTTGTQVRPQPRPRAEIWRQFAPSVQHPIGYDPAIIRFYEDVITELQRELIKYKAMVVDLLKSSEEDLEVGYAPGSSTVLPLEVAERQRSRTSPASPMIGHEI